MQASKRVSRLQAKRQAAGASHALIACRAAGYVRVSTDEQVAHGHGLETQERAIRAFAESQGYELVDVIADPGVSGATRPSDRPGFARLCQMADLGQISILLVWKFDRLARQIVYAVTAVNELAEKGVALRSVTEPVDTASPMGRTIFAVLAGMAEQERQSITERTWSGRREKAGKGGFAGGVAPYGYERDSEGGLRIVPEEAAVVRLIFKMRAAGVTLASIAAALNEKGTPTRHGKRWRIGRIAYLLDNPKYRGDVEYLFQWGGTNTHVLATGKHEAIVA